MKTQNFILPFLFVFFTFSLKSQLSGNAFLAGQTNHSGIKVKFTSRSGTAVTDSTLTDTTGHYTINISNGVYDVSFFKTGFMSVFYQSGATILLTNTIVLSNVILQPGNFVLVSGSVSGNWTNNNTYIVNGDITVPPQTTLNIQAGTTVKFNGYYSITANGVLNAIGAAANPVVFTSNHLSPAAGDWKRIVPNNSNCIFDHCIVEYGSAGLSFNGFSPTITNSTFRNLSGIGIYCSNGSPTISNNEVYNITCNTGGAIGIWVELNNCCGVIECNQIYSIVSTGYNAYGIISGSNYVRNNVIYAISSQASEGIEVRGSSVVGNNFVHTSTIGIAVNNAYGNYYAMIANNTIDTTIMGIQINGGTSLQPIVSIVNNIITRSTMTGIQQLGAVNPGYDISNNLLWHNYRNYTGVQITGIGQVIGNNAQGNPIDSYYNLSQDPLYVNNQPPALSPTSPCLGAGKATQSANIGFNAAGVCSNVLITSLPELQKQQAVVFRVYPNPTPGSFTIATDNNDKISVQIYDISGNLVMALETASNYFDAGKLPDGVYSLTVRSSHGAGTQKLVILH